MMTTWYDPEDDLAAALQELYMTPDWQEGEHLEFKSALNQIPKDLWKTYSAFANSYGGIIVMGVEDDGMVCGVKNVQARITDLTNTLNNRSKCSINLCRDETDIFPLVLGGKEVLVMHVPQASPESKPVYLCGNEQNSYKRNHEGDYLLKRSEIDRMVRDRGVVTELGYSADMCIVPHSALDDLDEETVYQFLNLARTVSRDNSWVSKSPEEFLRYAQCYRRDRSTGEEGVTLAGLLMFGKAASLSELVPAFHLDYIEYDGSEAAIEGRWADRVTSDEARNCNLFHFFHRVLPKVQDSFKHPFRLSPETLAREEGCSAAIAAREALVNALIHADYQCGGSVRILRYPDRLEFSNPGGLLMSHDALFMPHESYCRNKVIQRLFTLIGYSEKLGSGIDKIVAGMWQQCLSRPLVEEMSAPARVVWKLPYTGLVSREKMERIKTLLGEPYCSLSEMERLILALAPEDETAGVSNADLRRILSAHSYDISRSLSHLAGLGYLQARGLGRGSRYYLPEALSSSIRSGCEMMSPKEEMMSPKEEMMSPKEEMMSPKEEMMSPDADAMGSGIMEPPSEQVSSLSSAVTYAQIMDALNLDPLLRDRVLAYRLTKRNDVSVTRKLILELCEGRWLSVGQLAVLLERDYRVLGRGTVRSLVQCGLLKRRFADFRHKRQAYTHAQCPAEEEQP